jgi:hypothetical protein
MFQKWIKNLSNAITFKLKGDKIMYGQQGDMLTFPVNMLPKNAKELKHKVAAEGLVRHLVVNGFIYENDGDRYLAADAGCFVVHPEHKPLPLDVGFYRIKKVLEFDHWLEESREVID